LRRHPITPKVIYIQDILKRVILSMRSSELPNEDIFVDDKYAIESLPNKIIKAD
jgi:hypothetical protein